MRRKVTGIVGLWLFSCMVVMAADFWEEEEFTSWSDKDAAKMLTDSPWAKKVNIVMGSERSRTPSSFASIESAQGGKLWPGT